MRFTVMLLALMTGVLLAQEAPKPWMQGAVEKYCHQTEADIDRMRKEFPEKAENILLCACKHSCDPLYDHAKETDRRKWDAQCEAKCHPGNCNCKHPCDT